MRPGGAGNGRKKGKEKVVTLKTHFKEAMEVGLSQAAGADLSCAYHSVEFRELSGDCSKNTLSAMVKNNFLLSIY